MNNMSNNRKSNSNNSFKCSEVYGNGMRGRGASGRDNNYNQRVASRDRNQANKNNMMQNKYGKVNNTLQKNFNNKLYEGMYAEKKNDRNYDARNPQNNRPNNPNTNKNNRVAQGKVLNLRNTDPVSSNASNNKRRNSINNRDKQVVSRNNVNSSFNMNALKSNLNFNKNSTNNGYNRNSLNKNSKAERVQFNRNFNKAFEKKDRQTEKHEYTDVKNITTQLEDGQEVFPKSVFVFITVAVIFIAALIYTVASNDGVENTVDKLVNKATQNKVVQKEDRGLDLRGELDSSQFLADSREEDNVTGMFSNSAEASEQDDTATVEADNKTKTDNKTNTTNKSETTKKNTTSNTTSNTTNNTSNTTVHVPINNNQVSNEDSSYEEEDVVEEEDVEDEVVETPVSTTYIPLEVSGMLYHSTVGFASYGADTGFQRYTNFTKSGSGIKVATKDLDGIWIDVRGTKVIDYVGYKNGSKIKVVKISIEDAVSSNVKTIYAIKGTYIPLDGSYRKKDGTSTFRNMFASEDVELIRVGI